MGNCRTPLLYLHVVLSTTFKVRVEGQSRFQHRTAASVVGPADGKFLTIMTLGALRMRRTILKSNSLPLCTPRSMPPPPPNKNKKSARPHPRHQHGPPCLLGGKSFRACTTQRTIRTRKPVIPPIVPRMLPRNFRNLILNHGNSN